MSEVQSAKIYTFPARGRFAIGNSNEFEMSARLVANGIASSHGWYHDEAVQEEKAGYNPPRKS